jgi:hypothetical protein
VPRRVILNFGDVRGRRAVRGIGGKGDLSIPGLGAMRSFWFEGGIWRIEWILLVRSSRVEVWGRLRVCAVDLWWIVMDSMGLSAEHEDILRWWR